VKLRDAEINCSVAGGGTKITEELQGQKFDSGLELAQPSAVGVYHFYNHDTDSICSLICNGGPKVRPLGIGQTIIASITMV